MDHDLTCNNLKCRRDLTDHAVVTTCSHIFCLDCASILGSPNAPPGQRPSCPACNVPLNNQEDAVVTNLNPSEDYKTSILSGLAPTIIMECAGRALSFWAYQMGQEILYQGHMARSMADKYSSLSARANKLEHDANLEIGSLNDKLQNMKIEYDKLADKHENMRQANQAKAQKQMAVQELYDKLKRSSGRAQVESAAVDAVDDTILAASRGNAVGDTRNFVSQNSRTNGYTENLNQNMTHLQSRSRATYQSVNGGWNAVDGSRGHNLQAQTPPSLRQRIQNRPMNSTISNSMHSHQTTPRHQDYGEIGQPPLVRLSSYPGASKYGMSRGMKSSHAEQEKSYWDSTSAKPRSRVAQRQGIGSTLSRNDTIGQLSTFR